jgi:hypothetical protein
VLDSVRAGPADQAIFAGILNVAARAGDLSVSVPDWSTLASSRGARARDHRSEILRAALSEVFREKRYPMITAIRYYGDLAAVCVSYDRFRALDLKLDGTRTPRLTATFRPPKPPRTRRSQWEKALRELQDEGWSVRGRQLVRRPMSIANEDEQIHRCVAKSAQALIRELASDRHMLRRYDALSQPGPATTRDLAL